MLSHRHIIGHRHTSGNELLRLTLLEAPIIPAIAAALRQGHVLFYGCLPLPEEVQGVLRADELPGRAQADHAAERRNRSRKAVGYDTDAAPVGAGQGARWQAMLESGEATSLKEIAAREEIDNSYVSRKLRLSSTCF